MAPDVARNGPLPLAFSMRALRYGVIAECRPMTRATACGTTFHPGSYPITNLVAGIRSSRSISFREDTALREVHYLNTDIPTKDIAISKEGYRARVLHRYLAKYT